MNKKKFSLRILRVVEICRNSIPFKYILTKRVSQALKVIEISLIEYLYEIHSTGKTNKE